MGHPVSSCRLYDEFASGHLVRKICFNENSFVKEHKQFWKYREKVPFLGELEFSDIPIDTESKLGNFYKIKKINQFENFY
jgi:hypothetical protein